MNPKNATRPWRAVYRSASDEHAIYDADNRLAFVVRLARGRSGERLIERTLTALTAFEKGNPE